MRIMPFDQVPAWGQPWHGQMDPQTGLLTLPNGQTKQGEVPRFGYISGSWPNVGTDDNPITYGMQMVQLVQFQGTPAAPLPIESETAAGVSWTNYALLNGPSRQYSPLRARFSDARDPCFGPHSWLYKAPDGTVWCLYLRELRREYPEVLPMGMGHQHNNCYIQIRGWRVNKTTRNGAVIVFERGSPTVPNAARESLGYAEYLTPVASADGTKVLLRTGNPFAPGWPLDGGAADASFSHTCQRLLTVSGGSGDSLPSISDEAVTATVINTRTAQIATGESVFRNERRILEYLHMRPSGTISRFVFDYERQVTPNDGAAPEYWENGLPPAGSMVEHYKLIRDGGVERHDQVAWTFNLFGARTSRTGTRIGVGGLESLLGDSIAWPWGLYDVTAYTQALSTETATSRTIYGSMGGYVAAPVGDTSVMAIQNPTNGEVALNKWFW